MGTYATPARLRGDMRGKDKDMHRHTRTAAVLVGLTLLLTGAHPAAGVDAKSSVEEIRKELMQLPYYGVFDFLAFSYDKGSVTLMGYAYHQTLKKDAGRAVKRASGVDQVVDKIEELPASQNDDDLRWKTYYAIYRDPFLSKYAPGGGALWGHRHAFGGGFHAMGPARFPGMEPIGDYPIHIIVKNGKITLLGVVDNESDKTVAGMRAREVPGSFGIENELVIEKEQKPTSR
jgi:hyperosmotically inducible periplasmic protein